MPTFAAATVRRALEIARLAPSAHNTQPWRVTAEGGRLVIGVDPRRHLAHSDPLERDLHLAMGGFVAALRIALRDEGVSADAVDVKGGAFAALALRWIVRAGSEGGVAPAPPADVAARVLPARARAGRDRGARRRGRAGPRDRAARRCRAATPERAKLDGWFFAAARESWLDARGVAELRAWLRFDPEGARAPADGLSTHCLGLGTLEGLGALLSVREGPWRAAAAAFVAPLLAEQLAAGETREVARAPFLALLVSEREDAGLREGVAGEGLLRTWLAATELGLALHPISALLDRRGWEVARLLGVSTGRVLFAARLGRSAPPPRSGRLPVDRFAKLTALGALPPDVRGALAGPR